MPHLGPILSIAERVDATCDRFEQEWRAGRSPRVEDYVAAALESDREELRRQLLALEQELQARGATDTSVSRSSVREEPSPALGRTIDHVEAGDLPRQTIGRFHVHGKLGHGAFGQVYRAFDPQLGREVAIKVPLETAVATPTDRQKFLKEARAAATINHPNICQIHEVGEHDGRPYIVMALVKGQSLADHLKSRQEPISEKQAAMIVRKVALALAAAHDKGIVHRDLKPANIMFDRERKDVIVMDFGLARGPRMGDARGTQSGVIMGTPAYMSPEQASGGSKDVGPAGDIYSLGVVLYELLTGTRPFKGTATEVIGQILHVDPEKPSLRRPSVDPRLELICLKAMAKRPEERFASMKEFAAAIDAVLRTPKPASGSAETMQPVTTRRDGVEATSSENMADLFAVMSLEREATRAETAAVVEAAIAKHRTPRWVFVAIGLAMLFGFIALGGIIFFTRTPTATVMINIDVDLNDKTLSFFLDGKQVPAESLQAPIELKVGTHELIVKRGEEVIRKFTFTVSRDAGPRIELRDESPPKKEPPQSVIPPPLDIDRNAAIKVLQLRGIVTVQVGDKEIVVNGRDQHEPFDQFPKEPFQITQIDLRNDRRRVLPTDSLEPLAGLRHLKRLTLEGAEIGGNGIRPLAGLTTLEFLNLDSCRLTDADLVHLKHLANLTELSLAWNQLTGTGFVHLKGLTKLKLLSLYATHTTDDNLTHLHDLPELERLVVHQCQVTGKTFPNFKTWPRWKAVYLRGGPPSSKDLLPHLKTNPALEELALNMAWTDDDLAHLATNKALRILEIDQGGAITNRGLAYLSGLTNMQGVLLKDSQITDEGLEHLLTWKNLGRIHLPPAITHRGVAKLRAIKTLRVLGWRSATDEGMVYMKDFPNLKELWLNNSKITDAGLKHLHGLPNLIEIGLKNTAVTTAGIQALKESYKGRWFQVFLGE